MGKYEKIYIDILRGSKNTNINFSDVQNLLRRFGFSERCKGDHFIYTKSDIVEIINIQPIGNKAKAYQVKQIREIIVKYKLEV